MKLSTNAANTGIDADRLRQMNRRKEQNRNAQRRLRERKEEYTSQLEAQLNELHRHSQTQEEEHRFLREALDRMRTENHLLVQQIAMIHQSVPSTQESHPLPQRASIDLGANHFAQTTQLHTRSRSQSETSKHRSPYALVGTSSSVQQTKQDPSPVSHHRAKMLSSTSPTNIAQSAAAGSQGTSSRSPSTLDQDESEPSPFGSDGHLRSGSEQTETTNTSFTDMLDSAAKSDGGSLSRSSYSSQPTSDSLMTNCLENIYTQPGLRPSASISSEQSSQTVFDFSAPWTPSAGDYAAGNLMLADLKALDSRSACKPLGVTPGALGSTNHGMPGMPGLGASGEGWTISPWFNVGNTPSWDTVKAKADDAFPEPSNTATDTDHIMTDDRQTSLASRRGFSRTLNLEQTSF